MTTSDAFSRRQEDKPRTPGQRQRRYRASALKMLAGVLCVPGILVPLGVGDPSAGPLAFREIRVLAPKDHDPPRDLLPRVYQIVKRQAAIPGIRPDILEEKTLTITLATASLGEVHGAAVPSQTLIILSLDRLAQWESEQAAQVVRHELAHILLAEAVGFQQVPVWFDEGFAEWASRYSECRKDSTLRDDLIRRTHQGQPVPSLLTEEGFTRTPVGYAYACDAVQFLARRWTRPLESGRLFQAIATHGFLAGVEASLGTDLSSLDLTWQESLHRRFLF